LSLKQLSGKTTTIPYSIAIFPSVLPKLPRPVFGAIKLTFFLLLTWQTVTAQVHGHTGIPEIDSLPLHDWEVPNPPLSTGKALAYGLLPGGAQFYGNHPVRGGFLLGLETLLFGFGLSSYLADLPKWNRDVDRYLDSAQALYEKGLVNDLSSKELAARLEWLGQARERAGLRVRQADLANSEIAWGLGLHLYGMLDGQEIVRQSHGRVQERRTVSGAFWRGLLFPGGGQLYNHRYGKFGMLWMGLGASALSAWSRQQVVEFLNDMTRIARVEKTAGISTNTETKTLEDLDRDRTLYRKRRNQYFWGIGVFYIYSVMDGMVDAALSDFDKPDHFALGPGYEPMSLALTVNF
jgi:TM2 domain-containing membrane protein YozV